RQMHDAGLIAATTWERLVPELDEEVGRRLEAQRALLRERPGLEQEVLARAREEGLRAQRAALMTLLSEGLVSEEVYGELGAEGGGGRGEAGPPRAPDSPPATCAPPATCGGGSCCACAASCDPPSAGRSLVAGLPCSSSGSFDHTGRQRCPARGGPVSPNHRG